MTAKKEKLPRGKLPSDYPPTENAREQARLRRSAKREGADPATAVTTRFTDAFCLALASIPWDAAEAHRRAELATKTDLDLSGYDVEVHKNREEVNGKMVDRNTRVVMLHDRVVPESEIRLAQASFLASLPEVKARVAEYRKQMAAAVTVSAESLAVELEEARIVALQTKQPQAAVNASRLKAEMFGVADPGQGEGDEPGQKKTTAVNINIRDFSGRATAAAE